MSFSVTILLTTGVNSGPTYNIYECVDDVCEITPISGSSYTIESNVPVTVNGIDVGTTSLKIQSIGTCTNSVIIPIQNLPAPTPTPTVSPSPTPTIGTINPTSTPTPTPTIGSIPPTPTPTITQTNGLPYTMYTIYMKTDVAPLGWDSSLDACNGTGSPIPVYVNGVGFSSFQDAVITSGKALYISPTFTIGNLYNGQNKWYKTQSGAGGGSFSIGTDGAVSSFTNCA